MPDWRTAACSPRRDPTQKSKQDMMTKLMMMVLTMVSSASAWSTDMKGKTITTIKQILPESAREHDGT